MGGQDLCQQFLFLLNYELLILEGVAMTFSDQGCDICLVEEELVKPGDLRKHLQVGEVLGLKKLLGTFGRIAGAAETIAKFLISGIAADQVYGVGLK
jgi:hypothetical protein